MKKRNFLLKIFSMLGLFGSFVVDDEGAGGDNSDDENENDKDDIANQDLDENTNAGGDEKKDEQIKNLEEKLKNLESKEEKRSQDDAVNEAIASLESEYEDFDIEEVRAELIQINKDNPEKAESLNNPAGWRQIYLEKRLEESLNENPEFGRNTTTVAPSAEVLQRAKTERLSLEDQASVLSNLL